MQSRRFWSRLCDAVAELLRRTEMNNNSYDSYSKAGNCDSRLIVSLMWEIYICGLYDITFGPIVVLLSSDAVS